MSENIGYHTRLQSDNTQKIVGGSFGGRIDLQTVERLVKAHFTVTVKPSGRPVFVDKQGREVSLYFTIDPQATTKGAQALKDWREQRAREFKAEQEREEKETNERENAMSNMTHDEIMRRLTA